MLFEILGRSLFTPTAFFDQQLGISSYTKSKKGKLISFLLPFLTLIPLSVVVIYGMIGDFSSLQLDVFYGGTLEIFGLFEIPFLLGFIFFIVYFYLLVWLIPTSLVFMLSEKVLKEQDDKDVTFHVYLLQSGAALTPLLVVSNIFLILMGFRLEILSNINEPLDYILLSILLVVMIYYSIWLMKIGSQFVNEKTPKIRMIRFLMFFITIILIAAAFGGLFL